MAQHAKRLKIRRKDLRQPDEFETLTAQALSWAEDNRGIVVAVVSALVALALVMIVLGRVRATRNETAAGLFRTAHEAFATSKYPEAADGFAALARDYPSTPFGRLATMYRGHALARQGDATGAATAYADFLASSSMDGYLRQEALVALGRSREGTGDSAAALEAYEEAGELDGPFRTDALLGAARLHEAAGRASEARAIYVGLMKDATDLEVRALLATKVPAAEVPVEAAEGATIPGADVR
jgi:tetratricopeptide (TPR) repeat protein